MTDIRTTLAAIEASNPPKEPAAAPADVPDTQDQPAAQPDVDDDTGEENETDDSAASDGTDAPARPKNKGVGKRINELTKDKHDAIRDRDYWREEAERLRTQANPKPEPPVAQAASSEGEKTLEDFDFDQGAYLRYLAKAEAQREIAERDRLAEATKRQQTFQEKVTAFAAVNPDYNDVDWNRVPINQLMADAIHESDDPPAIAFYLSQHLDESAAIAGMTPIAAIRAIGRIEALLTRAPDTPASQVPSPPKTVTSAPAVASNVSARSPVAKTAANMTVEDHIEKLRVKSNR